MLNENQKFSIGTVARIVGVSTHTLRAWEKRYSMDLAKRGATGRREYPPSEIERLKLVKSVLVAGYKISDVAHMSISELSQLNFINNRGDIGVTPKNRRVLIYGKKLSHIVFQSRTPVKYQVVDELIKLSQLVERDGGLINGIFLGLTEVVDEIEELIYSFKLNLEQTVPIVVLVDTPIDHLIKQRLVNANIEVIDKGFTKESIVEVLNTKAIGELNKKLEQDKLTPSQIEKLENHRSKIYCECPQHLTDLHRKLTEFIEYTQNCEVLSPKDSALHQHINQQLESMRKDVSRLVWDVAEIDGIELN